MNNLTLTILAFLSVLYVVSAYGPIGSEYELISINWPRLHKRSAKKIIPISIKVFNQRIDLNLKPVDNVLVSAKTPVYNIERKNSNLYINRTSIFQNMPLEVYEDEQNFASAVVNVYPNGVKAIENAIIGVHNLVIRPVTKNLLLKLNKNNTFYHSKNLYVVYTHKTAVGHFLNPLEKTFQPIKIPYHRRPFNLPSVVYPEVLVVVDYYLAKSFGGNGIVPYILAFWNQVDLIYRPLNEPKYKINIAGIVIPINSEAVDYISNVRAQHRSGHLSFDIVLNRFYRWLYNYQEAFPLNNYDAAITMTSTRSQSASNLVGLLTGQAIGLATVAGACQVHHYDRNVFKAGLILDNGDFSGVPTAAHELGHILGSWHDEGVCSKNAGFLMAPILRKTVNRFTWSKCSLMHFKLFLETNPTCLFNKPH